MLNEELILLDLAKQSLRKIAEKQTKGGSRPTIYLAYAKEFLEWQLR